MARLDNDTYDRQDYYSNPSEYYSTFSEKVSPGLSRDPRLVADVSDRPIFDRTHKWGRLAIWVPKDNDRQGC